LDQTLRVISQDAVFLRASYPGFDRWFDRKVLPGLFSGERTVVIEERDSTAVGLVILKHTATEKKLCTLRVRPHYESKGLGVRLFVAAFDILGTERPLLSVSDIAKPKFERLFRYFGFANEAVYKGRYLPGSDEFAYNGLLDEAGEPIARPVGMVSACVHGPRESFGSPSPASYHSHLRPANLNALLYACTPSETVALPYMSGSHVY